jgi:hypothetical protein
MFGGRISLKFQSKTSAAIVAALGKYFFNVMGI